MSSKSTKSSMKFFCCTNETILKPLKQVSQFELYGQNFCKENHVKHFFLFDSFKIKIF